MAREVAPMDLRLLAAVSGELDGLSVAAVCRERGVSRKTFYEWRARYVAEGVAGLEVRSPSLEHPGGYARATSKRKTLSSRMLPSVTR
jgi:transposase-like protein